MKSIRWISALCAVIFLIAACGDASLEGYKPKDQAEADIKALLVKYKTAIDNDDMVKLLSCFHENCKFMNPTGKMITKKEQSKELPHWLHKWDQVDISKVQIELNENSASVTVKEKFHFHGHQTLGLNKMGLTDFELTRENGEWTILELSSR